MQLNVAGSKKYHVPVFDPLEVKEVRSTDLGLEMVGQDIRVVGFRNVVLKDIRYSTIW
jgi:hypothetical protein